MQRSWTTGRRTWTAALVAALVAIAGGADREKGKEKADAEPAALDSALKQAEVFGRRAQAIYNRTPPADRVCWGGLIACAGLGLGVAVERTWKTKRVKVMPKVFVERFRERLAEGRLDRGKGTDLCELHPSPASRVVLAALRRWGRPTTDIERSVGLARRAETDRLRRHVGTLRRIAGLAPLLGLLGSLMAIGRTLRALEPGAAWGPPLAGALGMLTAGVGLAILALVAYDALAGRVETLDNDLDRLGAEVVDALAIAAAVPIGRPGIGPGAGPIATARTPHRYRADPARGEP
jgi:biopolymer transport protein ExbB